MTSLQLEGSPVGAVAVGYALPLVVPLVQQEQEKLLP